MANILTYIELDQNEATSASLWALNRGRDVASDLGATLYAVLPCATTPTYDDEDIIAVLSRHGADKVILISHHGLAPPALFATHGEALVAACHQFPPQLVIFPASTEAHDLAPRLAISLRAHYTPNATFEKEDQRYLVVRRIFRRRLVIREPLTLSEHPMVVTLHRGGDPEHLGDDEAEVVMVHASVKTSQVRIEQGPVDLPDAEGGPTVGGGGGLNSATFEQLELVARALGGSIVASTTACSAGLARSARRVGLDGSVVESPRYLALGISGSERHVAGLAPHTEVVAVNTDPSAPIFASAQHGLVADAEGVLRELLKRLNEDPGAAG